MRALGAPGIKQVLFEKWSTIGVAATLMIIGTAGLLEARAGADAAEDAEVGLDAQEEQQTQGSLATQTLQKVKRTFITGFVHGLSPDGLFMLFPLLTMSASSGMMHLIGIFGGTCLAMSACTAGLCYGARRLARYSAGTSGVGMGRMQAMISGVSSLIALGFGAIMMYTGLFRTF
jgi:sulfite exporter TauE/SafE